MTSSPSERKVKLVVYSDLVRRRPLWRPLGDVSDRFRQVCPWCYIGHKEIKDAIAASSHLPLSFEIEYRPYQLDPSMNTDLGVDVTTYLTGRLGPERYAQIKKVVAAKANSLGMELYVSLCSEALHVLIWLHSVWHGKIGNTHRAHRLILKAWQVGGQTVQQKLLEAIFVSRFEKGENPGDVEVLGRCSEAAGFLSAEQVADFFDTDECADEVTKMIEEARTRGVSGVPFTIIENKWAVSGGQTSDVYYQVRSYNVFNQMTTELTWFVQIFNKLANCYASRGLCPSTPKMVPKDVVSPEAHRVCTPQIAV
jgi:predicted DsbA family dithiol-disulfide isomerase